MGLDYYECVYFYDTADAHEEQLRGLPARPSLVGDFESGAKISQVVNW